MWIRSPSCGRSSSASARSRSIERAARERLSTSTLSGRSPRAASAASRRTSASERPDPAAPRTSSGPARVLDDAALAFGRRTRGHHPLSSMAGCPDRSDFRSLRTTGSGPAAGWSPDSASCSSAPAGSRPGPCTPASAKAATAASCSTARPRRSPSSSSNACTDAGAEFTAISEERGEVVFGDGSAETRVVVDPIDGSLNARRMLPSFALSVAVASGPSMADVELGFVHDFGSGEEFTAEHGARRHARRRRAAGPRSRLRPRAGRPRGDQAGADPAADRGARRQGVSDSRGRLARADALLRRGRALRRHAQRSRHAFRRRRRGPADRPRGRARTSSSTVSPSTRPTSASKRATTSPPASTRRCSAPCSRIQRQVPMEAI